MYLKRKLASFIGKTTLKTLRLLKKSGSSYPGKVALSVDKDVLSELAHDYETIIITGTNGKTLTTALTVQALKQKYPNLLTNSTGSNMKQGIVSAFLSHKAKKGEKKIAVLEVDEANLVYVVPHLKPKIILTTNIFRDQMDRFGEIYTIYQKILDGIMLSPETIVVANGDSPIFHSASLPNKRVFFGFNYQEDSDLQAHYNTDGILCPNCEKILRYRSISYSNLGKYYCPNCQFKRPNLDYAVTNIDLLTLQESVFDIDGHTFTLPISGLYNIYNALAAYSIASLMGISVEDIKTGFKQTQRVFGRQEIIHVDDKSLLINLIKNPTGLNQVLDILQFEKNPFTLISVLNDNYADGQDVSWIWDGQYEQLQDMPIQQLVVGGKRHQEMSLRLEVAGFKKENMVIAASIQDIIEHIKHAPTKHINVLATYTAMLELRRQLSLQGYVKGELN
ncbi:Mur ligase family protein [Carnobacteriaceae bacterium zg-ZUI78]|nr:Mur ligase family protein [Carnobacteriaceae bacterium zg-ZUI78]